MAATTKPDWVKPQKGEYRVGELVEISEPASDGSVWYPAVVDRWEPGLDRYVVRWFGART